MTTRTIEVEVGQQVRCGNFPNTAMSDTDFVVTNEMHGKGIWSSYDNGR